MKAGERDYRDFLEDMAQYAEKGMHIIEYIDYDAFQCNEEKVLAAIRVIEVIGEAAKKYLRQLGIVIRKFHGAGLLVCVIS